MAKSELMEQALKEGVSVDENDTSPDLPGSADSQDKGAKEAASPTPESQTPPDSGAKAIETEKSEETIDSASKIRQTAFKEASEWKRRYQALEERLAQIEQRYTTQLEQALANINKTPSQIAQLPDDQKQALIQLVRLIKSVPEAASELGLGGNDALKSEIDRIQTERMEESFNSEFDSVIDKYSSKFGIDSGELAQELKDYLTEDEHFASMPPRRGIIEKAMIVMLSGREDEMKERASNLKLIQAQKEKRSQNTESPSKAGEKSAPNPHNMKDFLRERIAKEGGLSV